MKKHDTIGKAHLAAARAVDHLRRQLGLAVGENGDAGFGACPVEGLTEGLLAQLRALPVARLSLLITAARARSLGLEAKGTSVRIDAQDLSLPLLQALSDPLSEAPPLPRLTLLPAEASHDLLLKLAKHAALLPALLIVESRSLPEDWAPIALADVKAYWEAPQLDIAPLIQAALPIAGAEQARVVCFRERYGTSVHLALIIGDPGETPLTRVHSSCVTGDILGSLRCDCGGQLQLAIDAMIKAGSGILLYLHQEGRGIGIANKLRAYALQERGLDTYEANLMLGFEEDERDFSIAAALLKSLGISNIRMLTNNPRKLQNIEKYGITVTERIKLAAPSSAHNHAYIEAKSKKAGHLF
jgi:GTP cyclohydrolase II